MGCFDLIKNSPQQLLCFQSCPNKVIQRHMLLKSPPKPNDSFQIAIDHCDKDLSEMKTDSVILVV